MERITSKLRVAFVVLLGLPAAILSFGLPAHAQSSVIFPPIGGLRGGQFVARCPEGQLLTGFELRTVDDVDAIRPLCVTAYGPADVGPPVPGGIWFGGDAGGQTQLVCPADAPIVIGMYVRAEGVTVVVNNIHLWCGLAATTQNRSELPNAVFDGPDYSGSAYSGVTHSSGTQNCPAGLVAAGINGRSGTWLDAVGLICGEPKLTTRPRAPGPVKAIGRANGGAPTGPPRPICDVAREARARNSPAAPGLEAQCRAFRATPGIKALGRVDVSPPTGAKPRPICDVAREARARNSPAAPGLEAQCRAAGAAGEAPVQPSGQAAPTITAGSNPVIIPNGQASATTIITWKAAPAYTYSEIYLSVDNAPWSEFAKGGDGSKPTTIKPGSTQTFRMMVYEGQVGTPKIITTLTVTAKN